MPLSDRLSITAPLQDKTRAGIAGKTAESLIREPFQALRRPLPGSVKVRNGLSLLLLLVAIAWYWQPLAALYSLTQEQEHYSHILLIPWVSLYAFYLNREAILTSREWSPALGLILFGLGAVGYLRGDPSAEGVDHLFMATLAWVVTCWGIFLFCFGVTSCRTCSLVSCSSYAWCHFQPACSMRSSCFSNGVRPKSRTSCSRSLAFRSFEM